MIALVSDEGHRNALEAIQRFHVLEKETVRFQSLMALLGTGDPTLQLTCMASGPIVTYGAYDGFDTNAWCPVGMQLINALTNTRNLGVDTRMHIRNEMMTAGLRKLLPTLKNSIDPNLRRHISLWEKNSKWDIQEIRARYVHDGCGQLRCGPAGLVLRARVELHYRIQKVRLDYHDIEEVFRMVEDLTTGTKSNYEFQRLLQSLLVTPQYVKTPGWCTGFNDDHGDACVPLSCRSKKMVVHGKVKTVPASAYFKLCERVTEQIVFPQDGFDADFDNFRFNQMALIEVRGSRQLTQTLSASGINACVDVQQHRSGLR